MGYPGASGHKLLHNLRNTATRCDTGAVTTTPPAAGWPVAVAAARIGVTPSTLRSWERRYGVGPTGRTAGGHRRYTARDLAQLQRMRRLSAAGMPVGAAALVAQRAPRRAGTSGPVTALAEPLREAADRLDRAAATAVARRALRSAGAVEAWEVTFAPALRGIGRHWRVTGEGVHAEHLLTAVTRDALDRYAGRFPVDGRSTVLLAAAPDEAHTLPLHAVGAALAEARIGAEELGTLPAQALHAAVRQLEPAVLVLFSRSRPTADTRLLRALQPAVAVVCAAGIGWPLQLPAGVHGTRDLAGTVSLVTATAG